MSIGIMQKQKSGEILHKRQENHRVIIKNSFLI